MIRRETVTRERAAAECERAKKSLQIRGRGVIISVFPGKTDIFGRRIPL